LQVRRGLRTGLVTRRRTAKTPSKNRIKKSETRTQKTDLPTKKTATRTAESLAARLVPQDPTAREGLEEAAQDEASSDLNNGNVDPNDENGNDDIDFIEILNTGNCDVNLGDTITFQVLRGPDSSDVNFATVIAGVNADIVGEDDSVTITNVGNSSGDIEFFTDGPSSLHVLDEDDALEVATSSIYCGDNNGGGGNNRRARAVQALALSFRGRTMPTNGATLL
jgi:predicted  nucleic acid-binding Zn-ribbon protein